jgi:hypothetical protein
MKKHEVILASPPDREKLVAEISVDHEVWAEINQETEQLVLEIYPRRDGKAWVLQLNEALEAVERATKRLSGELP